MELTKNTILHTKDGRIIGNAIIINISDTDIITVKTDYGNEATFTENELLNTFHIAKYTDWQEQQYIETTHKNYTK